MHILKEFFIYIAPYSINPGMKFFTQLVPLMATAMVFTACTDEYTICENPKDVRVEVNFYTSSNGTDLPKNAPNLNLTLLNSNTKIIINNPNRTGFAADLNPMVDSSKFSISIDDTQPKDTITFFYTSTKTNISALCGDAFFNKLLKVKSTTNTFDSIKLVNNDVTNITKENVRIYF